MLYVKTEDLKVGMRLARPIYNRKGTLLYERDSKLTQQGIVSVQHFGLIGLFILEPAEPVPPMSNEDIEFERFQTMSVFTVKDELEIILNKKESKKINMLANQIVKQYGNLYNKINFMQNLRSRTDYIYKHAINTAILCALISHQLDFTFEEQLDVVMAALLHDIHKLTLPVELVEKEFRNKILEEESDKLAVVRNAILDCQGIIQNQTSLSSNVKKIIIQFHNNVISDDPIEPDKLLKGTKVLRVAEGFDSYTAMKTFTEPTSEVSALRMLLADSRYDKDVVSALTDSIHILACGVCVTLTNNDKGIVIVENDADVLRPVVLSFNNNTIMDLGLRATFGKVQVLDVMKTMDNRFVMGQETIQKFFHMGGGVVAPTEEELEVRTLAKEKAKELADDARHERELMVELATKAVEEQRAQQEQQEQQEQSASFEESQMSDEELEAIQVTKIAAQAAVEETKALQEAEEAAKEAAVANLDEVDPFAEDGDDEDIDVDSLFDF